MEPVVLSFLFGKAWKLAMAWKGTVEEKKESYFLLRQPIWRFNVEWKQYKNRGFVSSKLAKPILERNRNQILDVFSPFHKKVESNLYDNFLELTDILYKGSVVTEKLGESKATEIGDNANKKAIQIIEWIDSKLKKYP